MFFLSVPSFHYYAPRLVEYLAENIILGYPTLLIWFECFNIELTSFALFYFSVLDTNIRFGLFTCAQGFAREGGGM